MSYGPDDKPHDKDTRKRLRPGWNRAPYGLLWSWEGLDSPDAVLVVSRPGLSAQEQEDVQDAGRIAYGPQFMVGSLEAAPALAGTGSGALGVIATTQVGLDTDLIGLAVATTAITGWVAASWVGDARRRRAHARIRGMARAATLPNDNPLLARVHALSCAAAEQTHGVQLVNSEWDRVHRLLWETAMLHPAHPNWGNLPQRIRAILDEQQSDVQDRVHRRSPGSPGVAGPLLPGD